MWAGIFGFNPKKPVGKQVCAAHIEWRVWRNGSVTVFQTEGVGSSPATRTNKEDRQISVCCAALLTQFPTKVGMGVRIPCPPQSTTKRCSVVTQIGRSSSRIGAATGLENRVSARAEWGSGPLSSAIGHTRRSRLMARMSVCKTEGSGSIPGSPPVALV